MSVVLQAASNETPDTTQPVTSAVTGNSNTGHSATTASASAGSESEDLQVKTCRWFSYGSHSTSGRRLQFSWSLSGSLTLTAAAPGTTQADAALLIEYSTNNGSSWSTALTRSFTQIVSGTQPLSDSGSVDLDIGAGDTNQVMVRDRITAHAVSAGDPAVSESASISATVSGLQLDITPLAIPQLIVMM